MPSAEDTATLTAHLQGVDEAARRAETEWGVGRLPLLVSDDLRAKFLRQGVRFEQAYEDAWAAKVLSRAQLDAVISAAGGMQRAWSALDAAAREAGHKPADPEVWEAVLEDGSIACIVRTNADASKVIADGRALNVWTLEEVARAIDLMPEIVCATKLAFPGAQVMPARDRAKGKTFLDDPIPF
jgi:hypothetical protein